MRLYANENFPKQVVNALRRLGHDVLTTNEAGTANQAVPDEEVLAYARQQDRAVLTLNRRDFIKLHRSTPGHAGIVICTRDSDIERQARQIDDALTGVSSLVGKLLRVNRPPQ